jgi:peptidyl-dipeptidase A
MKSMILMGTLVFAGSMSALEPAPTAADARAFVERAEASLKRLGVEAARADWVNQTFLTDDTDILSAAAQERVIGETVALVNESKKFDGLALPEDVARKLKLIRVSLTLAAPSDPKKREELPRLVAGMQSRFGKGRACLPGGKCLTQEEASGAMASLRDPKQLAEVWTAWQAVGAPMRQDFTRYVALGNEGAKELGFADMGAMWRSKYDMEPDAYAKELDRLWDEVKPLFLSLHAYVRWKLRETYGDVVPANGPIPMQLLGDLWAQTWSNVYPLVAPKGADPGYDLTKILQGRKVDEKGMVRYGEGFFTSLGFRSLPPTFWERSMLSRPRDREVVCYASAHHIDYEEDVRLKECVQTNAEDFGVVHHELGHDYYFLAYHQQPFLFEDSANDGFHEAVGDAVALSITPAYLVKLGLLQKEPPPSSDIGFLLRLALDKVGFLPFGLTIDKWRWKVFSGEVTPDRYNASWWEMRKAYHGIVPPGTRTEKDFDPGAKLHVAGNTPYSRYFLADVLQFQFHRAMAKAAGCKGPLHRCSVYGDKEAGKRLWEMLQMGSSRPWPDALEKLTGQRRLDAGAIVEYFAPLKKWLDEENKGKPVGW